MQQDMYRKETLPDKASVASGPGGITKAVNKPIIAIPGPLSLYDKDPHSGLLDSQYTGNPLDSADGHFLSHVKQESPVVFFNATHEPAKLVQKTSLLPDAAPNNIVGALALRKVGEDGGFFSVVEKLIERDFQSARQFLKRFDGRNGMAILDAGDIATKQSGALFDVPLGKLFFFAHDAKPIANNHSGIVS
jgi:hypothetical protein